MAIVCPQLARVPVGCGIVVGGPSWVAEGWPIAAIRERKHSRLLYKKCTWLMADAAANCSHNCSHIYIYMDVHPKQRVLGSGITAAVQSDRSQSTRNRSDGPGVGTGRRLGQGVLPRHVGGTACLKEVNRNTPGDGGRARAGAGGAPGPAHA